MSNMDKAERYYLVVEAARCFTNRDHALQAARQLEASLYETGFTNADLVVHNRAGAVVLRIVFHTQAEV